MASILFKKSYLHKTLSKIAYDDLWNTKGVFTTIRLIGSPPKFIFLLEHLRNLNQSLKKMNINFILKSSTFKNLLKNKFNNNIKYDHLLRLAINNKKISISLRKCLKSNTLFQGILVNYQRPRYLRVDLLLSLQVALLVPNSQSQCVPYSRLLLQENLELTMHGQRQGANCS